MSFWNRLLGRKEPLPPPDHDASPESDERGAPSIRAHGAAHDKAAWTQLATVGEPKGPTEAEALATFRASRSSPEEASAVDALVRRSRIKKLPESLAIALAAALSDRGEIGTAIEVLASESSPAALLLAADLHAERGQVPAALALTERVLARDLDHPGARERHRRWREALGLTREATRAKGWESNTMVAREPDAPFVLLRELARGGAGAVYEAEDRELGRRVALKVYHQPDRDRDQLTHEARVGSRLAGASVVKVFDADPEHGWIALEWAPMGAVKDAIRGGAHRASLLPIEAWAVPLAGALAAAHADGWVHLDVKPANVLLKERGSLLADFGIARRAGEASPPGSLGYVSPERIAGAPASYADDVFGFGRLLEDVLDSFSGELDRDTQQAQKWRAIAAACTGPLETRPASAGALLTRLKVELA